MRLLKTLLFLLFFGVITTQAQQLADNKVTLSWNSYEHILDPSNPKGKKLPIFTGAVTDYKNRLPYFYLPVSGKEVRNFTLTQTVFEPFSAADAALFPADYTDNSPRIDIRTGISNKIFISTVTIVPLRRNPQSGALEKLVEFNYTYQGTPATAEKKRNNQQLRQYATNSVLSTGEWHRLAVTESGIYKIDRALLESMGLNLQQINTYNIKIFGNGGAMLPAANATDRPDDLVENAVLQRNNSDGSFDHILFYAKGPHDWKYDANNQLFRHQFNIYSDTAYYFLTVSNTPGMRVTTQQTAAAPNKDIYTFNDRVFHEKDLINVLKSGREWYGETFNSFSPSRDIPFSLPEIVPNSTVKLTAALMSSSPASSAFTVNLNGQQLGIHTFKGYNTAWDYHEYGTDSNKIYDVPANSLGGNSQLTVNIYYNPYNNSAATGYLNYLEVNAERRLKLYGDQTAFRSLASVGPGNVSRFHLENVSNNAFVWDITDPTRPAQQAFYISGTNGSFVSETSTLKEFIVFSGSNFSAPTYNGRVANQNLHALNTNGELDFVILAHPDFKDAANRLANHRRTHDNMNVEVVYPRQVYNEFSSGAQDLTAIRDFMKMIYERSNKSGDDLIYLLLFGDASFDYKYRTPGNTNYIPVFESVESLDPIYSMSSDDYIGFLDDSEGTWATTDNSHELDLGIGRVPVHSIAQANGVVEKLIHYDQTATFGKWRNKITFVADDGDDEGNLFSNNSELLINILKNIAPVYNIGKVYLDMFQQVSVPSGQRSPEANNALDREVEKGALILNYIGHGGETGWTAEQMLTINQINNWVNKDKMPLLLTATCEFGRYDDPGRPSGAEFAILNSNGGAIGLITTTRPVYADKNQALNEKFFDVIFAPVTKNGQSQKPRLGDIQQKTKNGSILSIFNRGFALLGDPSMRLAYPEKKAVIEKVNNKPLATVTDTLRALSVVKLEGAVRDPYSNNLLQNFNGKVQVTLFEKENSIRTLGDKNSIPVDIKLQNSIVYDGLATVTNGLFQVEFMMPKDISYNFGSGKVSLYAFNADTDGHGSTTDVIIGGSNPNAPEDNSPPEIALFMDDESFKFGGMTGTNSTLLANLSDESGINTAGIGIGHEITATLDGSQDNVVVLNDYYTAELDNYKAGKVRYLFKELSNGPHALKVKAWDNYNNSNEAYLEFIVANTASLALSHVLNFPNPFVGNENTVFMFDHNRTGDDLDIQVQIFTTTGKLVKTLETTSYVSEAHIEPAELTWNGRDEYNDVLAKGVYIYKVTVRSLRDGAKATKFEKLVMLK